MTIAATAASESHVGMVRKNNEDACLVHRVERNGRLYALWIVADGMGGGVRGEVASDLAITAVRDHLEQSPWTDPEAALKAAFARANSRVWDEGSGFGEATRSAMGTTLVAALIEETDGRAWFANVGDSRAYVLSGGILEQVSQDHSVVAALVEAGRITAEEARTAKERNVITRSIGMDQTVVVDIFPGPLAPGEKVILCSDGLFGMVADDEIRGIASELPAEDAVAALVALANERGGRDNVTVILGDIASTNGGGAATIPLPLGRWKQNRAGAASTDDTIRMTVPPKKRLRLPVVVGVAVVAFLTVVSAAFALRSESKPTQDAPTAQDPTKTVVSVPATATFLPASPEPTTQPKPPTIVPVQGQVLYAPEFYNAWLTVAGVTCLEIIDGVSDSAATGLIQAANPLIGLDAGCSNLAKEQLICLDRVSRTAAGRPQCIGAVRVKDGVILVWGTEEKIAPDVTVTFPESAGTPSSRKPLAFKVNPAERACFLELDFQESELVTISLGGGALPLRVSESPVADWTDTSILSKRCPR